MIPAKRIIKSTIVLLLLIADYGLFAKPGLAQNAFGLSAIPPRLEITVKPDEVQTEVIKVRNESNATRTITTTFSDFVVKDNAGTPIQVKSDDSSNRWAASSWLTVSPSNFKLAPGEVKSLVLTIMPPKNALPGGHYAMVLHAPENSDQVSNNGASLQTQVGTLVYVTIPGDINESAQLLNFTAPKFSEFGPIDLKSTIKNLSDIHITPAGTVTVKNLFGGKTAVLPLDKINIFPFTSRDFTNTLDRKWLFGRYTASIDATYGPSNKPIAAALVFWVIPWRLIALIIAVIAVIVTIIIINKNKPQDNLATEEKVEELEKELEELKKKYRDRK